jgi:GTPase Era involved in 16S rRNA processing
MPTIGNVSVGKSYFLNSLFGIDFCQVKSEITTKFILFIRHRNKIIKPKLYKLTPKKNGNSYDFMKDNEIITGKNNIKTKINETNNNLINEGKPIFYMLEIEIKSITNKTFLNKVDFLDVPGLNESNSDYISIYFPYIKDMIKYCLIIFSTENYNSKDCLEVINKVKNNIYVPMENFLLILNKIDKVNGKIEETIHDFKKIILNNEGINYYNNTIVPVNSLELKSEIQIETDFYHFINYYFIEYNNNEDNNNLYSFLEYIKRKISNIESDLKKLLKDEVKNLNEDIIKEIKQIFNSFIEEIKSKGQILIINFDENNEIIILKLFYVCFKKKLLIPKKSISLHQINNYFNNINDFSLPQKTKINTSEDTTFLYDDIKEHKLLQELDNFFNKTFSSSKLRKYGQIVPLLNEYFKVLKNYILNSKLIYIPILGISNSGKSSFLNCLIQKEILTCNSSECTRRGMIIKYIEEKNKFSLYSIKFKSSENLNNTYYYYKKAKLISKKFEHIKEIINITNESFPKNEEESFFFIRDKYKIFR